MNKPFAFPHIIDAQQSILESKRPIENMKIHKHIICNRKRNALKCLFQSNYKARMVLYLFIPIFKILKRYLRVFFDLEFAKFY